VVARLDVQRFCCCEGELVLEVRIRHFIEHLWTCKDEQQPPSDPSCNPSRSSHRDSPPSRRLLPSSAA